MAVKVDIHCLSTDFSTGHPGDPSDQSIYKPWILRFAQKRSSFFMPPDRANLASKVEVGISTKDDQFSLRAVRRGNPRFWALRDKTLVCEGVKPPESWKWSGWRLQSTQDIGSRHQFLTSNSARGNANALATGSAPDPRPRFLKSSMWQQDTGLLFMPVPSELTYQYTLDSVFWQQALWPQVICEIGLFNIQLSTKKDHFNPKTLSVRFRDKDGQETEEALLNDDGTYVYRRVGASGKPMTRSMTIRPQRWFDHWPSSFPNIKDPALCGPVNVAKSLRCVNYRRVPAKDREKAGWVRYEVEAVADEKLFHAFFNGPYGYRARYFMSESLGLQYEYAVVRAMNRNRSFRDLLGHDASPFRYGTKIWVNTKREHTDVKILNGVWEQIYLLRALGKTFDEIEHAGLRCSQAIPFTRHKSSFFKGVRVDTVKRDASGKNIETRLLIKSPWFRDGKIIHDPSKAKRALEVSAIGFV